MAKTNTAPITQTIKQILGTLANADSFQAADPGTAPTNTKLLYTAGAEGSVVKSLIVTSSSTSAHIFNLWISNDAGTTKHLLIAVNVTAGAGFLSGTTAAIDILNGGASILLASGLPIDQSGKFVLPLEANARLYMSVTVAAVTASKNLYVNGVAEEF